MKISGRYPGRLLPLLTVLVLGLLGGSAHAEEKPTTIRFSFPQVGVGGRPIAQGTPLATAHLKGMLEEEFKKDGIKISWNFLRGAGPAVNELFANKLTDFSPLGDLPSVIGRASGLKVRVIAGQSVRSNLYLAVPADSSVHTIEDLKGKRVAVTKGTATHLAGLKILESAGLTEKDVKLVNMDVPSAQLAIATKDIDAALGSSDYLRLRDQGIARILFTTRGGPPELTSNTSLVASEEFLTKYPETAVRVLKVVLKAAQSIAESNPVQTYQLWTKSGTTFASFREDLQVEDLKYRASPLLDPYFQARYTLQIQEAKRLGLIRQAFDYARWVEPKYLKQALKELNAEDYWQERGPDGKLLKPDTKRVVAPAAAASSEPKPAPQPEAGG